MYRRLNLRMLLHGLCHGRVFALQTHLLANWLRLARRSQRGLARRTSLADKLRMAKQFGALQSAHS